MKTPTEMFIDQNTTWVATGQTEDPEGLPVSTHEGILRILGVDLRVYRLSNGQCVINADDVDTLLKLMEEC